MLRLCLAISLLHNISIVKLGLKFAEEEDEVTLIFDFPLTMLLKLVIIQLYKLNIGELNLKLTLILTANF